MLKLNTFSAGSTLYYSLLTTNRVQLMALAGLRINDMRFTYNSNTGGAPAFNDLFTNPAANSRAVVLQTSTGAESATFGARFQYRLGKKENLKAREYRLGIDSGYSYCFDDVTWQEPQSKTMVRDMPAVKPDHFYLNFTFSALLLR
ncbi:hypothetical protein [Pontibacter chitinilyticus]|uniref:hypothetical protein n=1 Tax=Pontibacter chitinilyticus TaxID=2674989 RepID=UPI003218E7D5